MNILICDDMKAESDRLAGLLRDSGFDVNVAAFNSGYDALEYIHSGALIDGFFLDILMPEIGGIALAEQLRADGFAGEIVFLTTSNEYAAESYRVKAFSYLLKPPNPSEVRNVLSKLEDSLRRGDSGGLFIKVSKIARFILFRDISHIEVIKHYVYLRLINGEEIEIYTTFGDVASQLLRDERFAQCHRSYVVNMSDIAAMDEKEITMRSGKQIPNSKSYPDVKRKFTKWMIGGRKK